MVFFLCIQVSAQSSPKAGMLEQEGARALAAGQADAAARVYREAIALDPKNARLHLGAGVAAVMLKRDTEARVHFEQALALDPQMTRARAQLGQVLHRAGDLQGAIREYETVMAEAPDDAGVRNTLERWQRELELHERMRLTVGDHFTVSFEGPKDAELADQALASLERAFWRVCDVFSAYPVESIPVVLYSSAQFRDITRSPQWAAAAFDGTIRVPMRGALENPKELDRVLAHEFVHALIRSMAVSGVPMWLNEGLASALEREDLTWAQTRVQQARAVPALSDLRTTFGKLSGDEAQVAYAASAIAAERLLSESSGAAVANLLRDLGEGADFEAAFLHRIQRSFADFQAMLSQ
jgi:tetratricopeptide (TPR) repeat protein